MSYFDSEKNKALWEKRLSVLSQEKERRALEGYRPQKKAEVVPAVNEFAVRPGVRIITFEQLVEKEQQRHRLAMKQNSKQRQAGMTKEPPARQVAAREKAI